MQIPSPRTKRKARIEIIPLIDIIFFLLATFVMVSLSMVKNQGISVHLPAAVTSAPQDREDQAVITVTKEGEVFFNQEKASPEMVESRLRQLQQNHVEPNVFIRGDEKAYYGQAIAVLDQVRRLGIAKVAIETEAQSSTHAQ